MTKPFSYEDAVAPAAPASAGFSYEEASGEAAKPKQNKGLASDVLTAVKQGALQLPGVATGILDIAPGALGIDRPASKAADFLGSMTGFQPGKWAKEANAEYSPETQQAKSAVDQAWDDPNKGAADVAAAYLQNPRTIGLAAAQSVPSMLAGGLVGRGIGMAAGIKSAAARAAIGEGSVMAGSTMDQIDASVDPQKAAAASLVVGAGGTAIGAGGAKIASRFGNVDIDSAIAGGVTAPTGKTMSLAKRVPAGILQEGLLEEAPQSALETGAQNWAEGKPLTEGMARNVTEGALAGGLMGGGAAALTRQQQAQGLPDPDAGQPPAQPPAPAGLPQELAGNQAIAQIAQSVEPLGIVPDPTAPPNPKLPKLGGWTDANLKTTLDHQIQKGDKANKALTQGLANELARRAVNPYTPDAPIPLSGEVPPVAIPPEPVKPSEAMGIDPNAGAISRVAAAAVDGPASMEMAAQQANAAIAVEDNPEAGAPADQPAIEAPAQPQGAANVSNADAPGAVAAGTGGAVGIDANGGQPDAGLLGLDGGRAGAGTAGAPAPSVQESDAAPVSGRDSDKALTKGPTQTKAKVGGLKDLIARNKAAKANVQDQPQATAPAAAPAPAPAVQAPQAVGADTNAAEPAAGTGSTAVQADGVKAVSQINKLVAELESLGNKDSQYSGKDYAQLVKSADQKTIDNMIGALRTAIAYQKQVNAKTATNAAPSLATGAVVASKDVELADKFKEFAVSNGFVPHELALAATNPQAFNAANHEIVYAFEAMNAVKDKSVAEMASAWDRVSKRNAEKAERDAPQVKNAKLSVGDEVTFRGPSVQEGKGVVESINQDGSIGIRTKDGVYKFALDAKIAFTKTEEKQPATEPTNGTQTSEAIPQETGREETALLSDSVSTRPANVPPEMAAGDAPELADRWSTMTAEQRQEVARGAGWSTAKGTVNVVGKAIARKSWADQAPSTRKRLADVMKASPPAEAPAAPAPSQQAQEPAETQAVNAEGMSRADVLQTLEDGKKVIRFGETTWIDRAKTGKSDTYVVKTQDAGSTAVFTKGPAGPDRSWGWGRGDAAREAIKSWDFPAAAAPAAEPSPLVKAMNDLADVRAKIAAQGQVVDDRLLQRERQLKAMVKELEANGQNDELDAEMRSYENKAAPLDMKGRNKGDMLTMANGTQYRVVGVDEAAGRIRLVRNPDMLSERNVSLGQEEYDRLVADHDQTRAEAMAQPPAPAPAPQPAAKDDALAEREKAAKAKMLNAAAKLANLLSKNTRANITPEQEQAMLPIAIELFEGAMELGYVKFKQAAKYVRQFIANAIDQDAADSLPVDTLQGAYIAVSRRHKDKAITPKAEVITVDSAEEIDAEPLDDLIAQEDNANPENPNGQPEVRQDGAPALDAAPSEEGGGAARGGTTGASAPDRGQPDAGADSGPAGAGVSAPRGRGSRPRRVSDAATGNGRVGRGRGNRGAGAQVPGDDVRAPGAAGAPGVDDQVGDLFAGNAETASAPNIPATNFKIEDDLNLGSGGEVAKFRDNIAAIQTLKAIEGERRRATPEEQRILARFVGWGGLANAFPNPETGKYAKGWEEKGEQLRNLLTPSEFRAASRSTRNAHYTSSTVVNAMWNAVRRMGYRAGLALETSMGVGNFLGLKPADLSARFIGVEYDALTARMAKALYPQATVLQAGFQEVPLPDNVFDLSIGNPPFGDESLRFQFRPELRGESIHNQFFRASLSALKPGGLQSMVVSRYLMDKQDRSSRIALAREAELVAAIRLPDTAFKENARTEVVTDIIILRKRQSADKARMNAILDAYLKPKEKDYTKERERRELAAQAPKWIETVAIPDPLGGDPMAVNSYFAANPGQVVGVMERSGSMRYQNDVTVRLDDPSTLAERLDALVAKLPENIVDTAADVEQATERNYQLLGEALSMAVAREEAGHIKFSEDGGMTRAVEREFGANMVLSRQPLTANSPWSKQLFLDDQGRWYKQEVKVDAEGKPVKMLGKDGKPTNRNLYERTVYQSEADIPNTLRLGETGFARLKGLVGLRDLLKRQLVLETEDAPKLMMEGNRKKLAGAYAAFVAEHGPINRRANAALVSEMPDGGLILALEESYEPERTGAQAKKSGLPEQKESAKPAPIMRERVVPKYEPPTQAETPADALAINLAERGVVDIERIAKLLNITPEEAEAKLQDGDKPLIFKDPETGNYETANAYLSGHVRRKLNAARAAGLQKNVAALEAIQPERWGAENVTVQIGSSWVPADVYANFGEHLFGGSVSVSFSTLTNTFQVSDKNNDPTKAEMWSSEGAPGAWILGRLLNSQSPVVTGVDSDGKTYVDKERTSLAILKSREMVAEFGDWVFKDSGRRERLVEIFNEKFNTRVTRQFDGSHLKLPGKVPDSIIKMRRHQMNAIWRGISSRFLLIDHVVGAGKTFTAIARAMERRRMGLAQKPAIVVPNHLIEQWQADVYRLYPGAKVLAATKADFEAKNRRKLFSRIATGDYDIVILPHSSLGKIGISPETEQRYLEAELQEAIQAVKDAADQAKEDGYDGFRKPMGVKEAERLVAKIEARMAKLREGATDRLLTFEQLGIDDLTVDEAHEFKNLFYSSRMTGTRGMGDKTGSLKASDLYNKVRVLRDNGGSVVFMTGTPVSNSVVELYTMMRYLAASDLRDMGMEHFDAWRAQFVEATPAFEPDESNRLKEVTRLGRTWSNMRSMMDLYYQFTDAVSIDDIKQWFAEDNQGKAFPVPKVKGGDRQLVKMQPTKAQDAMLKDVIAGFDGLEYIKDPKERNAERLRLMDRARKLSLDARAADRMTTSNEKGGKLEKLSAEVKRIYDKWTPDRGTQLVFLDRSVPKAKGDDKIIKEYDAIMAKRDKALADGDDTAFQEMNDALEKFDANEIEALRNAQNGGWNAYQQIKDTLVASGIPADEIRFVQEANTDEQKQALFDAVKGGRVRVLIGSTPRMGAGTNVQDRLVALHHADVTWKPSDIEQREGRIIRQGNLFATPPTPDKPNPLYRPDFEVEILAYATERTVDAKMWSLNATKLRAINGLRKYTGDFTMEVEDEESVSMAEMAALASGNPLLLERVTLESTINGLELQEKAFRRKMYGAEDALSDANEVIRTYPDRITQSLAQSKELATRVRAVADAADARRVTIEGQEYATVKDALKAVKAAVDEQQEGNENARYAITINGERVTNKAAIEDAIGKALGDAEAFEVDLGGTTFTQRTAAGREVAAKLSPLAAQKTGQGTLGTMFGFKLVYEFSPTRFKSNKVNLVLVLEDANGKTMASADVTAHDPNIQFTTGKMRDLVGMLASQIEDKATGGSADYMQHRLERARRDLPTLQERVKETFPKAQELKDKRARLQEVVTMLTTGIQQAEPDVSTNLAQTGDLAANTADVVFSRAATPAPGIPVNTAQQIVDTIKARWKNAPEVIVLADMNDPRVPEAVREGDAEQRSGGATGEPEGFYYKGTAYVVAGSLKTPGDVVRVLLHESLGHHGLRGVFGDGLKTILKQIATMRKSEVQAKAAEYGLDMEKESDRLQAAEEVLAVMAQANPQAGFVKRAIGAIRAWLRENVPGLQNMRLTDNDIVTQFILPARGAVTRSKETGLQSIKRAMGAFSRGTNKAVTNPNDVVGNQGGRSADDTAPGKFAMAGDMVDGLLVRDEIPNQGSIGSSIDDYTVLRGIREIPLTAFTQLPKLKYYSISEEARTKRLAEQIKASGEINPLIVVIDKEGPYVLEGGHRFDALREIGKTSFPALVVLDNESLNEPTAPDGGGAAFSRTATDQTQTDAFKRWFNGSKVVDADGKPLVVYHGTKADILRFDPSLAGTSTDSGGWGRGIYFTEDADYAAVYAGRAEGSNILPAYVALKNPMVVDVGARSKVIRDLGLEYPGGNPSPEWSQRFADAVKARGHDGVLVTMGGKPAEIVAFRPEQIKSAIGNKGQFDPENPDIRFSRSPRELAGMATDQLNTALKSVTITSIKQAAGYKATDLMGIALGGLGRRQLVEIYGKDLPLDKYNELATQMEADKNEYGAEADSIATEWGKLKDEGALANIMHDATLAKIDPDKPLQPGDDPAAYNALKMRFSLMSKEAKETYRKARDGYKRHHANVREAIKERIERSQMSPERRAALVERMDSEFFAAMKGVYFPLARFGKYVVVVRGADGKVETVARSETMAEAAALRRNLVAGFPAAKGYQVDKVILSREFVASRDAVGRGFMQELYQVLDKQDMDPAMRAEMEDTLGQLYLSSLPDVSWAKHGIHRKGTPGFSQDARRAFAQNMFHGARYLAKLRYSDLMQTELKAMQDHVDKIGNVLPDEDGFNGPRMQRVVDEFYKRHDSLMNPNSHPLSTALTSIGFMFHLGLSPASALVNLTQTALVAYPIMGARWGFGKAGAALLKASKQAAMGRNDITKFLNRDERRAYDQAVKDGTIDVTQAHDLAGIAQGEDAGVMWRIRPAMRAASFLFHHAERFNRQATFVAAYRLAREAGENHETAFAQATKATYDGHYDYSAGNRPRFMQGNAAKVILLFKSYAQNMVYTLARNAYQSVNGLDPKERAEARKALAGILATHAMAAGVLGLPMVTTILAAISAAGSDDDEPFDAQVALQNMLADTFGQKPAEVITRGLSRLTPWDISGRVGLDRLIFPDVQEGLEGQRLAESAAFAALGPVAGIGLNILKGIQEIGDGHMLRGITTMMPAALRGPLNAVRLSNEGAQDKTGIPIVDEVDAASVFGQALGFSPSVVRQATEGKRAVLSYDRALNERRQELMTQYARGAMKQDAEAMQEAREAIQAFNEKNPGRRITMMQLHQSVRNRERRIDQSDNGVYLPKNRREAMDQGRFALTE